MVEVVPFVLKLTGDTSDQHQFQGYDGYTALAGVAWTLALVSHYVETGKIRQRGDFEGRNAVRANAPSEGSVIAEFSVWLQNNPAQVFGFAAGSAVTSAFLYDVMKRVVLRNLGQEVEAKNPQLKQLLEKRAGDIEALVAKTEAAIRQSHAVIGNGANKMQLRGVGGHNISVYDFKTRDYVKLNVEDNNIEIKGFSVAAFNVNSGHGAVFDEDLGRTLPISMSKNTLRSYSQVFTWGLDQYAKKTGGKIYIKYTRILSMDSTPKKYIVLEASKDFEEL